VLFRKRSLHGQGPRAIDWAAALMPLENRIRLAFIYGSVARQEERASSDIDLMVR
jgi:predicted nucleotidyltransferase